MTAEARQTEADYRPAGDPRFARGASRVQRAPAPETLRLYKADWTAFVTWCEDQGLAALPADPGTVAGFLRASAEKLSPGALSRRVAAIGDQHRRRGLASPAVDAEVRAILRAARHAATRRRRAPPSPAQLARMAAACEGDLAGLRDRTLLLLAGAGLGRAALVGLDVEHVRITSAGAELAIVDQDGAAGFRTIGVPRDALFGACPVRALEDWLRSSDTRFGPVFRKIDRWGNLEYRRLGTDAIRRILRRRAPRRARRGHNAEAT